MRTVTFSDAKVGEALGKNFVCAWGNRIGDFHDCNPSTEEWIFRSNAEAYTTRNICTFFMTPDLQVVHYVSGYFAPDLFLEEVAFASQVRDEVFDSAFAAKEGAADRFVELHGARAMKLKKAARTLAAECKPPNPARDGLEEKKKTAAVPLWQQITAGLRRLSYDRTVHDHSTQCGNILAGAYRYIASVHEDLASGGKGTGTAHAIGKLTSMKPVLPKEDNGWRSVRIAAKRHEPRDKKKKSAGPVETRVADFLPALSDVREDYLFGNPFAEETTSKSVVRKR